MSVLTTPNLYLKPGSFLELQTHRTIYLIDISTSRSSSPPFTASPSMSVNDNTGTHLLKKKNTQEKSLIPPFPLLPISIHQRTLLVLPSKCIWSLSTSTHLLPTTLIQSPSSLNDVCTIASPWVSPLSLCPPKQQLE